jgi:hypothetical protein
MSTLSWWDKFVTYVTIGRVHATIGRVHATTSRLHAIIGRVHAIVGRVPAIVGSACNSWQEEGGDCRGVSYMSHVL